MSHQFKSVDRSRRCSKAVGGVELLCKRSIGRKLHALQAEMADHLGDAKNEPVANPTGNTHNGKSKKTLKGDFGELAIEVFRYRLGSFEPQIVTKHQTRWAGFDDKILSLYARGEMYEAEVSPTLISSVTDAVMDDAKAWLTGPWTRCIPSSTWTASTLKPAMQAQCGPRRCTWRWASA